RPPPRRRCEMRATVSMAITAVTALTLTASTVTTAAAQERPAGGPQRPVPPGGRGEKRLPHRVGGIVTRQTVVPKVTVTLTVLSGYASDPPDLTGLANLTADVVQEGTKTRTSREIRRQAFGMGGSLTAQVSQDFSSLTTRGLAEFT